MVYVNNTGIKINMAANAFFIRFLNFLSIYSFDLLFWVGFGLLHSDIDLGWVWTAYSTQGCLFFNVAIHWPLNALVAILNLVPLFCTCSILTKGFVDLILSRPSCVDQSARHRFRL